jgi:hypothetical protein
MKEESEVAFYNAKKKSPRKQKQISTKHVYNMN